MFIRATWFGISGWLLAWSANKIWNWPESQQSWLITGLIIWSITLLFIPIRKPALSTLAWNFDRLFGLKEQFSTGYQISKSEIENQLHHALLLEIDQLALPFIKRVFKKGWRLLPDVCSLLVVVGLFLMVYQVEFSQPVISGYQPNSERLKLSVLGEDPELLDVFQIKMDTQFDESDENSKSQSEPGSGQGQDTGSSSPSENLESNINSQMLNSLSQSMKELGDKLNSDASTFEISQGLMSGDLNETADAVEKLSDQLGQMSDESRQDISEILSEQAGKLSEMGMQEASTELEQAAEAIENTVNTEPEKKNILLPNNSLKQGIPQENLVLAQESLDQIANSLREISEQIEEQLSDKNKAGAAGETVQFDAGTIISNKDRGSPKDFTRLDSDGGVFQFEPDDSSGSPLTGIPGDDHSLSEDQIGINQSAFTLSNNYYINYIVPYYYPWKWHNVVSKYFQRN
ncbi:MAG: apolipoprotein A1/A4/E family protein [Anaerolineaceae bacterium]|nr:apolipoprotein A1/A4/E family protein [Anaerolineaceae bacterium]